MCYVWILKIYDTGEQFTEFWGKVFTKGLTEGEVRQSDGFLGGRGGLKPLGAEGEGVLVSWGPAFLAPSTTPGLQLLSEGHRFPHLPPPSPHSSGFHWGGIFPACSAAQLTGSRAGDITPGEARDDSVSSSDANYYFQRNKRSNEIKYGRWLLLCCSQDLRRKYASSSSRMQHHECLRGEGEMFDSSPHVSVMTFFFGHEPFETDTLFRRGRLKLRTNFWAYSNLWCNKW